MSDRLAKERKETDDLKRQALALGIQLEANRDWWWVDMDNYGGSLENWEYVRDDFTYLTELGKVAARNQIREELRKLEDDKRKDILWERQTTQWKLTIVGMIISWVFGLVGATIALITFLRR